MNILITGASRGIGAATYELLKSRGHNAVGHSTRGTADLIAGDITDPEAPRRIWSEALDRLGGRIDALVNNAGIYEAVDAAASDEEWQAGWTRTLTINLQAPADLCRLAVAHFREELLILTRFSDLSQRLLQCACLSGTTHFFLIRSSNDVVEAPGTNGSGITLPPAASTSSRP